MSEAPNGRDGDRPDPDALLARVQAEERRATRARLKIWLGFAPGVGKTYAMLQNAREIQESTDLAVGWVDTHGRYDTAALLLGLDILPRRRVAHRGVDLEEFDLDAALARKPQVIVVDELAHTNAPGGRHPKRWQDVFELLDAGIEVHTTLNVQHVESLNDVIAQITGVRVRETVPDGVVDRADEIVVVDLQPEELLVRLREGKVYLGEQAERAAQGFFQRGNLLALRELALRRAAERVDADVLAYRREHAIDAAWPLGERILVGVGASPASERVIRAGRRIAAGLRAPWTAAWVERGGAPPLSPTDRDQLDANLRLAESLGATVVRLVGPRPSAVLLEHARRHNVTRIVIGKPTHARWRDLLRGSLLDEVVRGSGEIEVLVTSGDEPHEENVRDAARERSPVQDWAFAAGMVGVATAIGVGGRAVLELPDVAMLFLLAIIGVALRTGRAPSLFASALSVAAYDFWFVPPFYTFRVTDARHLFTFAMMFVVGAVVSALVLRIRRQERGAIARESRTAALYELARDLGSALDEEQAAASVVRHAADLFQCSATLLLPAPDGTLAAAARVGPERLETQDLGVARWAFEHEREAGIGTDTLPGSRVHCVPLRSGPRVLGVLVLAPRPESGWTLEERDTLDAFTRQGALALERAQLVERSKAAALLARTEEMRSSLLSAVSHDLRTPLASITGAASALRDAQLADDPERRTELVATIGEEADRLERLVGNLLDMTRLEGGGVEIHPEWMPLEEGVGSALVRLERVLAGRTIETRLDPAAPLLCVDPVLFEQLLWNLLENAAKHTPPGSPLEIASRVRGAWIEIEVLDRGPGLPPGAEACVFEKFWRAAPGNVSGAGLGLAICRAIALVHGGGIVAENRVGGGACFRVTLPLRSGAPKE
jgi:two-component system sensor histidine kinase KdpD